MPQNKIRTEDIVNSQITYAKIQNVSSNNLLLGRNTSGAGVIEELNAATAKVILSLNNVENVALSTWTGSTNLNTLGTITTGTWSGTTIATNKGGTGLSTLGSANQVLAVNSGGTALEYQTPLSGSGGIGRVAYYDAPKSITGSSKFLYDDGGTGKLSIGASGAGKLNLLQTGDNFFYQEAYNSNAGTTNYWFTRKSQGTTLGERVTTINNEYLGALYFQGVNNSNVFEYGAQIFARQFGAAGTSVPTRLNFLTYSATGVNTNQFILHPDGGASFGTDSSSARIRVHGSNNTDTTWTAQFHNNSGSNNALMIRDDGNVGIGTNTPTSRFDVVGTVEFQNPTTAYDGGVIGSELLTTGTGTGWTGSTFVGGYTHVTGNTAALVSSFTPANATIYQLIYTISGRTAGSISFTFGGYSSGTLSSNVTDVNLSQATTGTGALTVTPTSDFNGTVIFSVKAITAGSAGFMAKNQAGTIVYEERYPLSNTNFFQGVDAGRLNTIGTNNFFQGFQAGQKNTTGYSNLFQGVNAGVANTTGFNNMFQGVSAGFSNTSGYANVFQGVAAGNFNTTGHNNIFQGSYSGRSNTTGFYNIFQGTDAGFNNTIASSNIFVGFAAGRNNTGGSNNIAIGSETARFTATGTDVTNFSNSTFIGYNSRPLDNSQTNQIAIGYLSRGLGSNTTVIGNTGTTQTHLHGNLTLGLTNTPNARMVVTGSGNSNTTWTAQFHNSTGTNNALMIRDDGNVGIGTNTPTSRFDVVGTVEFQNPTTDYDGGVLGSELLSSSNWTTTGWTGTYASGFTHTTGNTNVLSNTLAAVVNNYYQISYTVSGRTAGAFSISFGGQALSDITATGAFGPKATTTGNLLITPSSNFNGTVIFSIKTITGSSAGFVAKNQAGAIVYEERYSADTTNLFQGVGAGTYNTTGNYNIFQGTNAGTYNTTGYANIFQGVNVGAANTTGSFNVFQGTNAGFYNTTGNYNIFQGANAGFSNTTGYSNIFQGYVSGFSNTSGHSNVYIGIGSAKNVSEGSKNVVIGSVAANYLNNGSLATTIDSSIIIGFDSRPLGDSQPNQVVVGYQGRGLGSNTTVIGNTGTTQTHLYGNLTLGLTNTPNARMVVTGSGNSNSTWTAQFHNSTGTNNALMIRDDGNVGIGTSTPTSRFDVVGTVEFQNPDATYESATLSSELLTTGTGTGWSGTSFTSGYLHTAGNTASLVSSFSPSLPLNQYYLVSVTVSGRTSGNVSYSFGGNSSAGIYSNTTLTNYWFNSSTAPLTIIPSSDFNGVIIASVKKITSSNPQFTIKDYNSNSIYEQRIATNNIFQGYNAGASNLTGQYNIFLGYEAGYSNTIGEYNHFIGYFAGKSNTTGVSNFFLGRLSGFNNTTGYQNIFIGNSAGNNNTTGFNNVFIGNSSGGFNTTGYDNTFIGFEAGKSNTSGRDNISIGSNSLLNNTIGNNNSTIGYNSLRSNTSGDNNSAYGFETLYSNTSGNNNSGYGFSALRANTTGGNNTAIGYEALFSITGGTNNVALGFRSSRYTTSGGNNILSDNSIFIGNDTRPLASGQTNQVVIGYEGRGLGSNTTVIGNTGTTISFLHGKLTAGETDPKNKLETDGSFGRGSFVQVSGTSYTVQDTDVWIRITAATGTVVLTLPDATLWKRREIMIMKISGAVTLNSASSNVYRFLANTAGTAILGTDGTYGAILVSDGVGWYVMG
jgi:hypothetical protein